MNCRFYKIFITGAMNCRFITGVIIFLSALLLYSLKIYTSAFENAGVGSQIVAYTQIETGDGPNKPNTINL